jgi:MFS superfamily sulfate permease-like transporter
MNNNIPKTGLAGLKAHFKEDILAGFSVSLIALPLCLGIAIASGVPPLAGLITAIVGGMIASRISGTFVTISGPAAGLIVITLGAAEAMGGAGANSAFAGYPHALGAIVIGGLIVAVFGFLKVGKVGDYFPSAAVHGMLAAIGIIIIIKQFFPAIGAPSPSGEILEVAAEMPYAFLEYKPFALSIALVSLAVLIIHPLLKVKIIKMIPAPMWVLIFTIPMAAILGRTNLAMVEMPHNLFGKDGFQFPSFEKIGESAFWIAVTGFALVSAIESLLSAKAVDSLDPYKRSSNLNKDLISMGAGSSLAATIGGLPMISEIVRSSANVNSGGKTQWSNFFHGSFLLVYLLIGVFIIEMIPISALAAMLVFTGFRLASPKEFKHMYQVGMMELEIFIVTIVAVLATDLIIGILIGILFKYALVLLKGTKMKELFKSQLSIEINDEIKTIHLKGAQIFSNYLSLKKTMDRSIQKYEELILDFSEVTFVDHTVMEHLEDYSRHVKMNGKELHIINVESLNPVSDHPLAARDKRERQQRKKTGLSSRTLAILEFAQENNFKFENQDTNLDEWEFYNLTIRKEIKSVTNILSFKQGGIQFKIADLTISSGAQTTIDIEKITVLKFSGNMDVPEFYMRKAGMGNVVKTAMGNADINFDSHPDFSKKYELRSQDEKGVRAFFNESLLNRFEELTRIFFSGNGKSLLIHQNTGLANKDQIRKLIDIGNAIGHDLFEKNEHQNNLQ